MGSGPKGQQRDVINAYQSPLWDANTLAARNAGNIMYGGDTSGGDLFQQSRQAPGSSTGDKAGPDQYGFYGPPDEKGRLQGKDRAHEIYRWMVNTGASPEEALKKDLHGGDQAYMQKLIDDGGGKDSVAYQGWQPRPDNVSASARKVDGQWVEQGGVGIQGGTGYGTPGPAGVAGQQIGDYGNILGRYEQFANTGGYSPEDLSNIRARAVSPIRSIYSGARRDIDRQRSLQGGYSPNRTAALAKMAREQSYTTADASTNVEASIAQMVQQGKLAGMGGMSGLYGTTPGLASTFGNQALRAQQLQNQAGFGMIDAQQRSQGLPTGFQAGMGNVSQMANVAAPFVGGAGQYRNPFTRGYQPGGDA